MKKSRKGKTYDEIYGEVNAKKIKAKMSKSQKGKRKSKEWIEKIRKSNIGKKRSKETRQKIREDNLKNPRRYWLGKKRPPFSKETIKKMMGRKAWNKGLTGYITSRKGIKCPHLQGKNSPCWKERKKTSLNESIRKCEKYKQWRSNVFERDNWTCQTCRKRGFELNTHHIKELNILLKQYNIKTLEKAFYCKELWNINNGVTLCIKCHKLIKHKLKRKCE